MPCPSSSSCRWLSLLFLTLSSGMVNWGYLVLAPLLEGWIGWIYWGLCAGFAFASVACGVWEVCFLVRCLRAEKARLARLCELAVGGQDQDELG